MNVPLLNSALESGRKTTKMSANCRFWHFIHDKTFSLPFSQKNEQFYMKIQKLKSSSRQNWKKLLSGERMFFYSQENMFVPAWKRLDLTRARTRRDPGLRKLRQPFLANNKKILSPRNQFSIYKLRRVIFKLRYLSCKDFQWQGTEESENWWNTFKTSSECSSNFLSLVKQASA